MSTFLKSNIEARFSSLIDGTHKISLFQSSKLIGEGIYLHPHQGYHEKTEHKTITITIFRGTGELELSEGSSQPLHVQVMGGDILVIPPHSSYKISNVSQESLVLSQLIID